MKHATLLFISIWFSMGAYAQQTIIHFPLHPIESDSVYFMDFFWHDIQEEAAKTPLTTTPHHTWDVKPATPTHTAKMENQWAETVRHLNILGESDSGSLSQSLNLFNQSYALSQLTGKARYIDMAEHILLNSILPRWKKETPGTTKDEATKLLRTVNQMAYSTSGNNVYINMPMRTNAHIKTKELDLFLRSVNSSPWYNETTISIAANNSPIEVTDIDSLNEFQKAIHHDATSMQAPCTASLHLRIPLWATSETPLHGFKASVPRKNSTQIMVNGIAQSRPTVTNGYIVITREWAPGDIITVRIPTPIMRLAQADKPNDIALQRGPFVYYYIGTAPDDFINKNTVISHQFSQTDNAVVLSGMLGNSENRFFALPYCQSSKKEKFFMPSR